MRPHTLLRAIAVAIRVTVATTALALTAMAVPVATDAHVNRTVGPYTFLIVLVEEPYFATNHAGFRFWVHDGDTPVAGLDRSLRARATGHGRTIDLEISPWDADQLYTVDRGLDGQAFDPLGGGDWSLRLTGTIDGTVIDESFAVQFPAYPRVGTTSGGSAASGATAGADQGELVPPYLIGSVVVVGGVVAFRTLRHRRVSLRSLQLPSERDGEAFETAVGRGP